MRWRRTSRTASKRFAGRMYDDFVASASKAFEEEEEAEKVSCPTMTPSDNSTYQPGRSGVSSAAGWSWSGW